MSKRESQPSTSTDSQDDIFSGDNAMIFDTRKWRSHKIRGAVLKKHQEEELARCINILASAGIPLNATEILRQAYIFCQNNNIKNNFTENGTSGLRWVSRFLKKHPEIVRRRGRITNSDRSLNPTTLEEYFNDLQKHYCDLHIHINPDKVYCMTYKTFSLYKISHPRPGVPVVFMPPSYQSNNATIISCANAAGSVIPPMVIFKCATECMAYLRTNAPDGTSAMMVSMDDFNRPIHGIDQLILKHFLIHLAEHKALGMCILVLDDMDMDFDYDFVKDAQLLGIQLRFFPRNSYDKLQPLAFIDRNLENFWKQTMPDEMIKHYANPINDYEAPSFREAWSRCVSSEAIIRGFREKGLYPHDPRLIRLD